MKPIVWFLILFPLTLGLLAYVGYLADKDQRTRTELRETSHSTYQAWLRTYRYPLTYDQWLDLKEKDLLPTQAAPFLPPN